jgi:trehalose synthase
MSDIQHVPVAARDPHRFASVLSSDEYQELVELIDLGAAMLRDRVIWNVSYTTTGDGLAELMRPLLSYTRGAGVDARWTVIGGGAEFFTVTKRLHNHLHGIEGDGGALGPVEREVYERALAGAAEQFVRRVSPWDVVILHDPQTAGMVQAVRRTGAPVIWRCHGGLDDPDDRAAQARDFLRPYVTSADAYVFSRAAFAWDCLDPDKVVLIQPSIDVFSPKNDYQTVQQSRAILRKAGILATTAGGEATFTRSNGGCGRVERLAHMIEEQPLTPDDPVVTQVSRWEVLKDPLGVLRGFTDHVAHDLGAHLLLAGSPATAMGDDPEEAQVFASVREMWIGLPRELRRRVHLASLPMDDVEENAAVVNALQRHSRVVVQKSLAEGFGLTVAEAMWKERAVVASRIGGIQDQIVDGVSGLLLSDPRDSQQFGDAVSGLLADSDRSRRIGLAAHDRITRHFLGPHHLGCYFDLVSRLITQRVPV